MKTIRLTTAQALVRWLLAQRTVVDGEEVAAVRRRVRHLRARQRHQPGRGPGARPGPAADLARPERAVDGPGRRGLRQGDARATDHDRHLVDRARLDQLRDRRRGRPRQPAAGPAPVGRHVPAPDRRPGPPAGRALRRPDDDGGRRLQAGDALLGSDQPPRADRPLAAAGAGRDARSGHARAGLPRAAAGHPGRGLRLPGRLLRADGPLHPAPGPGSARRRGGGDHAPRGAAAAHHRRRRRPLLGRGRHAAGLRRDATASRSSRPSPARRPSLHDHPNYAGPIGVTGSLAANAVAARADVVLAVGTRLQDFTTGSWALFEDPDVRFVSVNTAGWDAHKQRAQPVIGDARVSLEALDAALGASAAAADWLAFAQAADRRLASLPRHAGRGGTHDGPPAYAEVIQAINDVCADDDYCLSAAGGLPGELCMGWRSKSVGSFDSEYGYSTMGYEIAGAWGAKMARGDGRRHRLGRRRLVPDDELRHLLDRDDRAQGHLHRLRQRRLRGHQPPPGQLRWRRVQQPAAHDPPRAATSRSTSSSMPSRWAPSPSGSSGSTTSPAAFARAKAADRSYVIVVPIDPYAWTEGGAWWEVGIPEVSDREQVRAARERWEVDKRRQRVGV